MHINITKSETGNNKGSCSKLVSYLEKENNLKSRIDGLQEYWFNQSCRIIQPYEVRTKIDGNNAKLSKDEAKFFLVNISPSRDELLFLKSKFGEQGAEDQLKIYANKIMDAYATNFKRSGINNNADLIYFAKLERHRYFPFKDPEVRQGAAKKGEIKPGEQSHVQVIVSRKDSTNKIKLSPLNNSRGRNERHSEKVGQFDRVAFKQDAENIFDSMFGYERRVERSFKYANCLKNGSNEDRVEVKKLLQAQQRFDLSIGAGSKGLVEILLRNENDLQQLSAAEQQFRKRKKKRLGGNTL